MNRRYESLCSGCCFGRLVTSLTRHQRRMPARSLLKSSSTRLPSGRSQSDSNTDVLNMSLNVTDRASSAMRRWRRRLHREWIQCHDFKGSCGTQVPCVFYTDPGYVAHHIGSATYGTYFALNRRARCLQDRCARYPAIPAARGTSTPSRPDRIWNLDTNQISLL